MNLTKDDIFRQSNGGLNTYQALFPNLITQGSDSRKIDSPFIAFRPNSFSIRKKYDKWYFEDKATGSCGDIFDFMAVKTGLNREAHENHLIEIIAGIYSEGEDDGIAMETVLFHKDTATRLSFSGNNYHKRYLQRRFGSLLNERVFDVASAYELYTLNSLSWLNNDQRISNIVSGFKIDVPQIFFAFLNSLYTTDYAMIYEPFFRICYDWGERPDDFVLGYHEALQLRNSHSCTSDKLIITDNVESLFVYHSQGQPAIALVDKSISLSYFILDKVLPEFTSAKLHFKRRDRYDIAKVYTEFNRKYGLIGVFDA